jgi:hypothetical protein
MRRETHAGGGADRRATSPAVNVDVRTTPGTDDQVRVIHGIEQQTAEQSPWKLSA